MGIIQRTMCAWFGHSKIVDVDFYLVSCARCGVQIADTLQTGGRADIVIVGHDCEKCRANAKKLTWRDKLFTRRWR